MLDLRHEAFKLADAVSRAADGVPNWSYCSGQLRRAVDSLIAVMVHIRRACTDTSQPSEPIDHVQVSQTLASFRQLLNDPGLDSTEPVDSDLPPKPGGGPDQAGPPIQAGPAAS